MTRAWRIAAATPEADDLAAKLNISKLLAHLLVQRGVTTIKTAKRFLNPNLNELHSASEMKGVAEAVSIILKAIASADKICIYGDFDVDGVTAAALMYEVVRELGGRVFPFIPNRFRHGYGLNADILGQLADKGYRLLITVDNGIAASDEVELAKSLGMQVIVTDHHRPAATLPPADAVIDPKQPGCDYPFKDLAGVGVVFKLAQALGQAAGRPHIAVKHLDFVALGTIADLVPLLSENRVLVSEGLKIINNLPRPGIKKLMEVSGLEESEITSGQIGYVLAPRLNAAGRLSVARDSFNLLVTDDVTMARNLAIKLNRQNQQRQQIEESVLRQALEQVEKEVSKEDKAIVLASPGWHDGVKGIVASRLIERYFRPVILFTERDGVLKGSGRSIPTLDIYEALSNCRDLLISFGGHRAAAGINLAAENFELFRERFNQAVGEMLDEDDLIDTLLIDAEVDIAEVSNEMLKEINRLAPFGAGNPQPKLLSRGVFLDGQRRLGNGEHLQLIIQAKGCALDAVAFKIKEIDDVFNHRTAADVVYQLGKRQWNGEHNLQLQLVDFRLHDSVPRALAKEPPSRLFEELFGRISTVVEAEELFFRSPKAWALDFEIRFIDRRGLNNVDYLKMVSARGQKTLIYAHSPAAAAELAYLLNGGRQSNRAAIYYNGLPAKLKTDLTRYFLDGRLPTLIFCGYPVELMENVEINHLMLWHPPFCLAAMRALITTCNPQGASLFVHLLFDKDDLIRSQEIVEMLCPNRHELGNFYRALLAKVSDAKIGEKSLFDDFVSAGFTGQFVLQALRVFKELGLVNSYNDGTIQLIPGQKVNLELSSAYNESQERRSSFMGWAEIVLTYPPAKLLSFTVND